jgi:hypothetical protein
MGQRQQSSKPASSSGQASKHLVDIVLKTTGKITSW